jgi:short-subunit dehydrogenase
MLFNSKVIWITGASSGIGAELARQFSTYQTRLILSSRNESALEEICSSCQSKGSACHVLPADMLDNASLPALAEKAISVYGHIDIVIFSAGASQRSMAHETNMGVYRHLMELNFFAPITITRHLLEHFRARSGGHLVVISSIAGLMGFPLRTGYAASKHALKGFFESLLTEHQVKNMNITIVSPGRINTPISLHALNGEGNAYSKMDEGQLNGIPVADCAKRIIKAVAIRKKHLIIARSEKILYWLWWFARPVYYKIARKKGLPSRTTS